MSLIGSAIFASRDGWLLRRGSGKGGPSRGCRCLRWSHEADCGARRQRTADNDRDGGANQHMDPGGSCVT